MYVLIAIAIIICTRILCILHSPYMKVLTMHKVTGHEYKNVLIYNGNRQRAYFSRQYKKSLTNHITMARIEEKKPHSMECLQIKPFRL